MNLIQNVIGRVSAGTTKAHNTMLREAIDKQISDYEAKLSAQVRERLAAMPAATAAERAQLETTLNAKKAEGLKKLRDAAEAEFASNSR